MIKTTTKKIIFLSAILWMFAATKVSAQLQDMKLLNVPIDISNDFKDFTNTYYLADSLSSFDPVTATGKITYKRYNYATRQAFNNMLGVLRPVAANEFPTTEYEASPKLPFSIQFVSARTVRVRATSGFQVKPDQESLMLVNGKAPVDKSDWKYSKISGGHRYTSQYGSVTILEHPWHVEFRDATGKLLTKTVHNQDNIDSTYTPVLPFSYVRRAADYSRSMSAAFSLSPGEKIFGCGESFASFNKRGQKVVLWADDANGVQNETMYKPIPFFMSSRGYGMFMHTSTPITCDFGKYFSGVNSLMIGDDELDLFVFLGEPKDILNEYTNLTGKATMPPLWSFGFWMSRITYVSEQDGRDVAAKLRANKIPADVIHYDTGWFTTDWRTDYKFAPDRFKDPAKLMSDLKKDGFHVSLWQLPYFTPKNTFFNELVKNNLVVKDGKGNLPYEDAVLDFSNPATVKWYQDKIAGLLKLGVGVIKVDFGEAAPNNGLYHSGRTGFYEHNLYPLRYNKAVADITRQVNGENIIWARSAWAGSQRYPLHWGGDAANTNTAMAAELRGGLSFGLSGFAFWSHDMGGFVLKSPENLYARWAAFGLLSSHSRSHGAPPKEPWEYSPEFLKTFRLTDETRYKLMPYIYAQAKDCTERGLPMVRALFVEYPNDPGSWLVDDQYLFGSDILVAPLFENVAERDVYLPPGQWIDYQTGQVYNNGWNKIKAGPIQAIILVKEGAVIPHIKLAQSTMQMDWSALDLVSYAIKGEKATALICLPSDNVLRRINVSGTSVSNDAFSGKVKLQVKPYTATIPK
ncbi:glycoside hydrolase family 31 protein [Mucilaginibacter arboris]|uniref:Alpha-xylosidase n=1 Tax=Mucilaginibacter arboris TaxID=2682090 RepID=A0A7K1T0J2_9SPHI|nr:alpha-xylosidase [Mucilaginibacter arboris]MVN23073.1 alpha-xylosidase [Mucilaginibacter arboris]